MVKKTSFSSLTTLFNGKDFVRCFPLSIGTFYLLNYITVMSSTMRIQLFSYNSHQEIRHLFYSQKLFLYFLIQLHKLLINKIGSQAWPKGPTSLCWAHFTLLPLCYGQEKTQVEIQRLVMKKPAALYQEREKGEGKQ